MSDNSGEGGDFSDGLDEFEESAEEQHLKKKNETTYSNRPYDEAVELSQDLSVAESFDGRQQKVQMANANERKLKNDKYDEAVDVSQSMEQSAAGLGAKGVAPSNPRAAADEKKSSGGPAPAPSSGKAQMGTLPEEKTNSFMNGPFDEALEFSQSNSDESVDTRGSDKRKKAGGAPAAAAKPQAKPAMNAGMGASAKASAPTVTTTGALDESGSDESEDGDDNGQQNYENMEGAYDPKAYSHLNVSAEVRDLFQYIERYKVQPVELETTLKCFIPDYIPSIGEMDAFIKVPRPDGKDDELGLKRLDEPAAIQSDPTVLELQLRAMSKKQQYGDVAVRSIENAEKSPLAIDKWIANINELHRSKPPPQVHYHKNMPDVESLMEVWPEAFEQSLQKIPLPPPDLDLTLVEYAKVLCSIVDIPVYDNPVESLHLMFTLFTDFRNNPHFQAMRAGEANDGANREMDYGGADVMQIDSDYK